MYAPIILVMFLYPLVACFFVMYIWYRTPKKLFRWLAVAFAVLLPTWDAVLSAAFFYTACPFFSKAEIYETAETEGIYYEGDYRNKVLIVEDWNGQEVRKILYADDDIRHGYHYVEALGTSMQHGVPGKEEILSPASVYRCTPLPEDPRRAAKFYSSCVQTANIESGYKVVTSRHEFGLNEINMMKIYNRITGKLMAEYREISKHPCAGFSFYPFFTWLNWSGDLFNSNPHGSCPETSQLFSFQYEVLKVKK
jgi:hypothetical protein